MKNDQNWTLRFARTGREAFGHDVVFPSRGDRAVWIFAVFGWGFLLGLIVGGL